MPKASRKVPLAAAISVMRSSPLAVSTSATIGTLGIRLAVSATWSTDSTIASITPPMEVPASVFRSSAHHGVPKPLTRTQSEFPVPSQRTTLSRAADLSLGATASSMSRTYDVGAGACGSLETVGVRTVGQQPTPGEDRVDARADVGRIGRVAGDLFVHSSALPSLRSVGNDLMLA